MIIFISCGQRRDHQLGFLAIEAGRFSRGVHGGHGGSASHFHIKDHSNCRHLNENRNKFPRSPICLHCPRAIPFTREVRWLHLLSVGHRTPVDKTAQKRSGSIMQLFECYTHPDWRDFARRRLLVRGFTHVYPASVYFL